VVVKKRLHKNLLVSSTVTNLIRQTKRLTKQYNKRINDDRRDTPNLIDKIIFKKVRHLLIYYVIDMVNKEYRVTKDLSD
jgi:hypothetical protein